jgi:flagellar biosynthesis protein FliQ
VALTSDFAHQLMGEMLWTAVLVCAPILGLTMLVGLLVSIIQAVTQIQEMSLSFLPKIITVVAVIVVFGPWMLKRLLQFSPGVIANIPMYS